MAEEEQGSSSPQTKKVAKLDPETERAIDELLAKDGVSSTAAASDQNGPQENVDAVLRSSTFSCPPTMLCALLDARALGYLERLLGEIAV